MVQVLSLAVVLFVSSPVTGFTSTTPTWFAIRASNSELCMSSVGGGSADRPPNGGGRGGGKGRKNPLRDWLDPENETNKRIKETQRQRSESRLPISFNRVSENDHGDEEDEEKSSAMTFSGQGGALLDPNNPYLKVVQGLTPSELIGRFTSTAHPRVQSAVKATILGLIGSLPKMAFETKTVTTGERLASLMFQLQMTGYMFKNAEYRLTMSHALGLGHEQKSLALTGQVEDADDSYDVYNPDTTKLKGKIKVKYPGLPSLAAKETEVEVDANAYMSELRMEVKKLRDDLEARRSAKEEAIKKDLLAYIRTLPAQELRELTSTVSPEVLSAMKGLVNSVMAGLVEAGVDRDGKPADVSIPIGPRTVLEQSGEAVAQLCMWQLVVGYNLRELEVREEMKQQMAKGRPADIDDTGILLDD